MSDKRDFRRFNCESSIFLKFENDPETPIEGKLLDISFIGLGIFLKEGVNVDAIFRTIVQFNSFLSMEQHLVGRGKVVYVSRHRLYAENGFRIGLEFVEVNNEIVINILNRLESKILEQIRKKNQKPEEKPD